MSKIFIYSYDDLRAIISEDGSVFDSEGNIIGFINEDGSTGDINQNFIGEINSDGTILNENEDIVGYVDLGKSTLRDETDSHFATILRDGTILDRHEIKIGYIKNFTYFRLRMVSAYLMLLDKQFFNLFDNFQPIRDHKANESDLIDLPSLEEDDFPNDEYYKDFKNENLLEIIHDNLIEIYYIKILFVGCPPPYVSLRKYYDEDSNQSFVILNRKVIVNDMRKEIIHKIKIEIDVNITKCHVDSIYKRNKDQLDIYIHASEEIENISSQDIQVYEIQDG